MKPSNSNNDYKLWLTDIKSKIRSSQIKAALAVNAELINFYWELGKMISEKENIWGNKLIETLSSDLKTEFPELGGFSTRNLRYRMLFYKFYNNQIGQQLVAQIENNGDSVIVQQAVAQLQNTDNEEDVLAQQLVAQIPWSHNILIFSKSKSIEKALFYINKTIQNQWSRDVLSSQIDSNLYERQGKIIHNFEKTLPEPFSDLAQQTLKDPYIFNFLSLDTHYREKDLENQLVEHLQKFLLELGKGFAFVGKQYHLNIAESDYYLDLLFYHIHLKCYVVIELKNNKFIPEYAGKLNFYLSAVDTLLKLPEDNPTIGLLLCKHKNNIEAEFALRDMNKPMGVSEFQLTESLPENLKSSLPTIEEIENELLKQTSKL
jgi:predicted nuclease of restriction endonuclease-like (RecB) superfamily